VTGLVSEVRELSAEDTKLRAENAELREENAALRQENTRLKVENQLLRDEIARLKNLPPRPPFRPSGMEKATDFKLDDPPAAKKKPRGPKLDIKRVSREEVLRLCAPPTGSRFKGYKSCHVRDLVISAEVVHYRRECWLTPDGKMLLAPLPAGIIGSYGANLRRFCLMLHAQGQVTMERLTTLLHDVGVDVSKRQVVRLVTQGLDSFVAEDAAVLHAGLLSAPYITVDDTGARHARANFHTTQIGGAQFTNFRTTPSKSRLNFLSLLRGNYQELCPQRRGIRLSRSPSRRSGAGRQTAQQSRTQTVLQSGAISRISGEQRHRHFRPAGDPCAGGSRHLGIDPPSWSHR